ncbi:trypco2 family protein [Pseudomonas sp. B21-048]|uniref:trypco2 family protein n=1 Tax=Pseudomonas sp. B21-048 TaxID=2895490 RepID=UPI002160FDBE|nr:trypco2 family protein [Pseudomonas sp. B21-048]UVL01382.1 hypothetical protein LOY56_17575 [Pseudomonas sp. B21-048]
MISLVDFIKEVKQELRAAVDTEDPFFEMGEVELEITFALDASAKAGLKLVVADFGGETKATQPHKVKVKLHPFVEVEEVVSKVTIKPNKGRTSTVSGRHAGQMHIAVGREGSGDTKSKKSPTANKGDAMVLRKSSPRAG